MGEGLETKFSKKFYEGRFLMCTSATEGMGTSPGGGQFLYNWGRIVEAHNAAREAFGGEGDIKTAYGLGAFYDSGGRMKAKRCSY